jgi:peptidoglycan/xylan/chitin deacetylase (PgdA/CDA1 family)
MGRHTASAAARAAAAIAVLLLAACGSTPPRVAAPPPSAGHDSPPAPPAVVRARPAGAQPGAQGEIVGRSERLLIYLPAEGDELPAIARRLLGDAARSWQIAEANDQRWQPAPGQPLVVPLQPRNPTGVSAAGFQTVPILCYHRFGQGASKMLVAPERFEEQLEWLARNHYRVIRLADLMGFLAGREALPERSVVITIDDGYETVYRHAYPALKKYGFSATLFVYTDFIGARDGLSWAELQEMAASGVIDIQAHSKTHRNLVERRAGETDADYRKSIDAEARQPRAVLERRLAAAGVKVRHFAFPFGDANDLVLDTLVREGYDIGVTVNPGGNPFFAQPMMLRRTMIFGDHDLDDFKARLQTRRGLPRP